MELPDIEKKVDISIAAWTVAGVPLVLTLVQTILSLLNWTSETLGIRDTLDPILSIDVLFEAAELFKDQPSLVVSLFILIAVAWIVQGLSMLIVEYRDLSFGVAGFGSILYLVLFFGVYSPLLDTGIPVAQLVSFFMIPIFAMGLVVGAAVTHDWSKGVLEKTSGKLGELRSRTVDTKDAFESSFDAQIGDLTDLEPIAPIGVGEADAAKRTFQERCDDAIAEIEQATAIEDADQRRSAVSRIESQVESLDPQAAVNRIEADLQRHVESGIRTEIKDTTIRSRYGRAYKLSNLPTEYRETRLPPHNDPVRTADLADVLQKQLKRNEPLNEIGDAIAVVFDHMDRVEAFLMEYEEQVDRTIEQIGMRIDTVEQQLDRLPGKVRSCAGEILMENRSDAITGFTEIERTLGDVKDALHECRFDECDRLLEVADANSEQIVTAAEFFRALDGRVQHGASGVDIPASIDPDIVKSVVSAMQQEYAQQAVVEDGRVRIGDGEGDPAQLDRVKKGPTVPAEDGSNNFPSLGDGQDVRGDVDSRDRESDSDGGTEKRPEEVLDAALYFLRELERQARDTESQHVQYQTDDLPPAIANRDMLLNAERFLQNQSDLFSEVNLQEPDPPAFVEIVVTNEVNPTAALRTARERYTERYG